MRTLIALGVVVVFVSAAQAEPAARQDGRSIAAAARCERRAVAAAVAHFVALVDAGRYTETTHLWLPRRRIPTPGFFAILGRNIRADRGVDVPAAARRWVGAGRHVELIQIDPHVNVRQPSDYGFAMAWFASSPGYALLGEGKGVWDCEMGRIAMFVGGEMGFVPGTQTRLKSEADARRAISGRCGKRPRPLVRLYGQDVVLCGAPDPG
jgi:hypothetical protein